MKIVDTKTGTLWLDAQEFARAYNRDRETIYGWIKSGFVTELGYILRHEASPRGRGFWKIGVPPSHAMYHELS